MVNGCMSDFGSILLTDKHGQSIDRELCRLCRLPLVSIREQIVR